jgi:hypothetical protein
MSKMLKKHWQSYRRYEMTALPSSQNPQTYDRLNNGRVNQVAFSALKSARQKVNPDELHALQLMLWGFQNNKFRAKDDDLRAFVENLQTWPPQDVMKLLNLASDREPSNPFRSEKASPEEIAQDLVEQVRSRLSATGKYDL